MCYPPLHWQCSIESENPRKSLDSHGINWRRVSESNIVEEFEQLRTINPTPSPCARNARLSKILGLLASFSSTTLLARTQSQSGTPSSEFARTLSLTISLTDVNRPRPTWLRKLQCRQGWQLASLDICPASRTSSDAAEPWRRTSFYSSRNDSVGNHRVRYNLAGKMATLHS